jgi:DNA-binding GntR family transcriptional regulator
MKKNTDDLYCFVRAKILTGEYPPGSKINVRKLCESFGVSRIPIRDVVNRLCGEGLVQKGSNGRFLIKPLNEIDIRETFELRAILEGHLMLEAAANFGPGDIEFLEENLKCQEEARNDVERTIQLNVEFHDYFYKATRNNKFISILKGLNDYQYRYDRINWLIHGPILTNLTIAQHREILDAVKKRNGELAQKIIKLHRGTGAEFLIKALHEKKVFT